MRSYFVHFSHEDVPALPAEYHLMLNVNERIVTLLGHENVFAQCRLSKNAFRILFLLLRAPSGANYAELLACLHCSDTIFQRLLSTCSHEDALAILAPQVARWNKHLEYSAQKGNHILERELKMVRRATKERQGANTILKENGFALTVKPLYRRGYLLTQAPTKKL
jgi:hypothetical protein